MSKRSHAENRDPGEDGGAGGSRSVVVAFVVTAIVLHGIFTVGLPALILDRTGGLPILNPDIGPARWLGAGLAGFGIYLYLWSAAHLLRRRVSSLPDWPRRMAAQQMAASTASERRCGRPKITNGLTGSPAEKKESRTPASR